MPVESRRFDIDLHLSPDFENYAERVRAETDGPLKHGLVVAVQAIRRHPRLQYKIEQIVEKLGRRIDLSRRLA